MSVDVFTALNTYMPYSESKYITPEKAGVLREQMEEFKQAGQNARAAFTQIAKAFAPKLPHFSLQATSQWMNQAQIARPFFWAYFIGPDQSKAAPALALRSLYDREPAGISLELSVLERFSDEQSLPKLHRHLNMPASAPFYYFAQINGTSERMAATEENRQWLLDSLHNGTHGLRKVQLKADIENIAQYELPELIERLGELADALLPFYLECIH